MSTIEVFDDQNLERALHNYAVGDVMMMASVIGRMDSLSSEQRSELEASDLYQTMAPFVGSTALRIENGTQPSLRLIG